MGSATVTMIDKILSENDTDEHCTLLAEIKLKAETNSIDTASAAGKVFNDSFVNGGNLTRDEMKEMAEAWITIEDDPNIIHALIDDEIEELGIATEIQDMIIDESNSDNDLVNEVEMQHVVIQDKVSSALDCLKLFIEQNRLPDECSNNIN